ncbi:MAG: hypothetical protein ACRDWY_06670 [Actinomycetes bacterium]
MPTESAALDAGLATGAAYVTFRFADRDRRLRGIHLRQELTGLLRTVAG